MANILRFPQALLQIDQYGTFSDFVDDQSDLFFIDTITDSGSAAVGDGVKGIMVLTPSDGTVADNDEVYLRSANEIFKVADGKPMYGVCYLQFTETAAGVYNAAFGWQNAVGADSIIDDGGGLKVTGDTIAIYKVDGGTVWRCVSCVNGTATVSTSTTSAGGASYQKLEIEVVDFTSTKAKVIFMVDGLRLKDTDDREIIHTIAYASATEMNLFAGAKLGAITNNDVLNLDYLGGWQLR